MKQSIICLVCTLWLSTTVSGQQFDDVKITTHKINDELHILFGAGGNILTLTGPEGTLMVDTQFAPLSEKITAAINEIDSGAIKYVINTHFHGDHTGGNEAFATKGAMIIAHDNVRTRLSTDQIRPYGRSVDAAPPGAWPRLTFNDEMQIHMNGHLIQLIHVHTGAHTDSDALVYLPMANVLHMGDIFFKDRFPFIDSDLGGDPDGMIATVEAALMLCDADTQIVPGHGAISDKEDLSRYLQMLKIMVDRVKAEVAAGSGILTLDMDKLVEGYSSWGDGFMKSDTFVKILFRKYSEE